MNEVSFSSISTKQTKKAKSGNVLCAHGSQSSEQRGFKCTSAAVVLWREDWGNRVTGLTEEGFYLCAWSAGAELHLHGGGGRLAHRTIQGNVQPFTTTTMKRHSKISEVQCQNDQLLCIWMYELICAQLQSFIPSDSVTAVECAVLWRGGKVLLDISTMTVPLC